MVRAERVEKFLMDRRTAYEAGDLEDLPDHWVDLAQGVAAGCSSSELRVAADARDELIDNVKDDVALGIAIAAKVGPEDQVFSATVTDSDDRDLHFFFVAPSEDAVVERLIAAFKKAA